MAIHEEQYGFNVDDLEKEQVKQIALNHFYAYYVRRDMEDVLTCVGEHLQWRGSKEWYVAQNREEFRNVLEKELDRVPYDCVMKVVTVDVTSLSPVCYQVTGELELRIPTKDNIYYSNLRFTMIIMHQKKRFVINSIHTSSTGETVLTEGPRYFMQQMPADMKQEEKYDTITGLLYLDGFKRLAKKCLSEPVQRESYAFLCTDISNFEKVNNLYGLQKADQLLADLAVMLTSCNRGVVLCCRSVADHFIVLVSYQDKNSLERMLKSLSHDFENRISSQYLEAYPQLGMGVYLVTDRKESVENMVEYANMARKSLLQREKSPVAFYDAEVFHNMEKIRWIERRMKLALEQKEFKAYLQPKFDLETGRIVGAEALVRWIQPDGSMIYPDEFIPVFEKNGFIVELDFYILSEVCEMIKRRIQKKKSCVPVSINQSRVLLQNKDYVGRVASVLARYNTPPHYIELELTERIFRNDLKELAGVMSKLKDLGVRWSIDDFGTGYSSLNLLKELPVDIIKIDKSFLDETESSETSKIIIRKTVELTQELDMTVVCEGVETENQADYLRGIRCDVAQGYLYARPMPMEEFERMLDKEMYR